MEETQDQCEALILSLLTIEPRTLRSLRYVCKLRIPTTTDLEINAAIVDLIAGSAITFSRKVMRFVLVK